MAQADYPKIVAKAWSDPDFRKRLVDDPGKTLKDEGWDIHPSLSVQVKPDSDQHTLIIGLPKKPEGLSDERLQAESKKYCVNPCSS